MNKRNNMIFAFLVVCLLNVCRSNAYTYDYVICAIFQNEARFMKEWIEFHKLIGFQHFYLYNNLSKDNYLEVLEPYIERGEVDLIDWTMVQQHGAGDYKWQHAAYNDALQKIKGIAKWAAFIDLDEYIVPVQVDQISDILKPYEADEHIAGVLAKWNMFGHSDVECIPNNGLLTEQLTLFNPNDVQTRYTKTIVRPERVRPYSIMHLINCAPGFHAKHLEKDTLVINHYWTGDLKYFVEVKIQRLRARNCRDNEYGKCIKDIINTINYGNSMNSIKNSTIQKYTSRLKAAMFSGR
jgi:hypothetical protein